MASIEGTVYGLAIALCNMEVGTFAAMGDSVYLRICVGDQDYDGWVLVQSGTHNVGEMSHPSTWGLGDGPVVIGDSLEDVWDRDTNMPRRRT